MRHYIWEQWRSMYVQHTIDLCGMHPDDLPDLTSERDDWENGLSPLQSAKRRVAAAKREFGLD